MTSQSGQQTIAIHILPNISQSKNNQTIKFGQVKEFNKGNIFLGTSCRKWDRVVLDLSLILKKVLYDLKASGLQLSLNISR